MLVQKPVICLLTSHFPWSKCGINQPDSSKIHLPFLTNQIQMMCAKLTFMFSTVNPLFKAVFTSTNALTIELQSSDQHHSVSSLHNAFTGSDVHCLMHESLSCIVSTKHAMCTFVCPSHNFCDLSHCISSLATSSKLPFQLLPIFMVPLSTQVIALKLLLCLWITFSLFFVFHILHNKCCVQLFKHYSK